MSRRKCPDCCGGNCAILSDPFDDDASSTLSDDWYEETPHWSYDGSSHLIGAAGVGASALTVATSKTIEQTVTVLIDHLDDGDMPWVRANGVDGDNCFVAEVVQDVGANEYTVTLYRREGGSNTLLSTDTMSPALSVGALTPLGITICLSRTSFSVLVENDTVTSTTQIHYACNPSLFPTGKKAGVGNGSATNDVQFDDFGFGDFRGDTGSNENCQSVDLCCLMQCLCCVTRPGLATCIPKTITVTLHATGGCENSMDGETIDLEYNPGGGYWEGENTLECLAGTKWRFACEDENYVLTLMDTATSTSHVDQCFTYDDIVAESVSCDPPIITFPADSYTAAEAVSCDCCDPDEDGSVYADVTW